MKKIKNLREEFPMLQQDLVYLDSGALVQKPQMVIDAINDFYTKYAISNRTSDSILGIQTEQMITNVRMKTAKLLNVHWSQIFFNSGTTEGLNYAAQLLAQLIEPDDQILISPYNHTSHIIPWVEIAKQKQAKVIFSENFLKDLNEKTKIICYTQINNTFNNSVDLKALKAKAKQFGSIIVNDAAQAISHEQVDGQDVDIITFSTNKFFGPTGLGIIYINDKILNAVWPKKYGGGAVQSIAKDGSWKPNDQHFQRHEPGTLNLAAIYGFNKALDFFNSFKLSEMQAYLKELTNYAHQQLAKLDNIEIKSKPDDLIILFDVLNSSAQEVSSYLGHKNIYVRSGWFCAKYLENILERPLIRVSLHLYNNKSDIDKLVKAIKNGGDFLGFI